MAKKLYGWQAIDPKAVMIERVVVAESAFERLLVDPVSGRITDPYLELPVGMWWTQFHAARKELVKIMRTRASLYEMAAEHAKELRILGVVTIE